MKNIRQAEILENISESTRKEVENITCKDFSLSQELLDEYTSQKRNRTKAPWLITGLVKCPACKRLVKKSNWQTHKDYELN